MLIRSWCTITLGEATLLLPTDFTRDELTLPVRTVTYQPADYFRAAAKDNINRELVQHTFGFSMVRRCGSGLAARYQGMALPALIPNEPSTCVITGAEGGEWKLYRAVVVYSHKQFADRWEATFTLTGGLYEQTVGPSDPTDTEEYQPSPTPGDRVKDDNGDRVVDDDGTFVADNATI